MRCIKALWMSMGMFSTFPVPKDSWDDNVMPLIIPMFPLVGLLIGAGWYAVTGLFLWFGMPMVMVAALGGLAPFFLSGCLHLDGFMDTADAVFSRRDLEERKRILKDPHVGVFAVAAIAFLLVLHFGAFYTVLSSGKGLLVLICLCMMSRCATGIALLNSQALSETGFMAAFQKGKKPVYTYWLVCLMVLAIMLTGFLHWKGAVACIAALLAAFATERYLKRQMQGLSGDLCGAILTISEVCGLICMALL